MNKHWQLEHSYIFKSQNRCGTNPELSSLIISVSDYHSELMGVTVDNDLYRE